MGGPWSRIRGKNTGSKGKKKQQVRTKKRKNKKQKADIGNIATVDPTWLHSKRFNYLR